MPLLGAGTSLATGLALSGLGRRHLWAAYAAKGGCLAPDELKAYLTGEMLWPATEHDVAADILNEHCTLLGFGLPVAYASEQ